VFIRGSFFSAALCFFAFSSFQLLRSRLDSSNPRFGHQSLDRAAPTLTISAKIKQKQSAQCLRLNSTEVLRVATHTRNRGNISVQWIENVDSCLAKCESTEPGRICRGNARLHSFSKGGQRKTPMMAYSTGLTFCAVESSIRGGGAYCWGNGICKLATQSAPRGACGVHSPGP
jgi:hypothetical protein